jgi:hypothetical protein
MKTLEDAKADWLYAINGDGGYCPCCDRWGKIYPRQSNSSMARALIWLVAKGPRWTDVPVRDAGSVRGICGNDAG